MKSPMIYELRQPKKLDATKKYPAIFVFHGIGSNEQNMLQLVEGLEEQFYIFSIRGHLEHPPGFAYFTIQGYGRPHREVFDQAIVKLTGFIDYAIEKYPIDKAQLYLLGFSQGAILSMSLGLTLGNRIKGIVALSGYIPGFVKDEYMIDPVDQMSLFISHGEMDQVLPFEWGTAAKDHFQSLGADSTFHPYQAGHTVTMEIHQAYKNWLLDSLKEEKKA